jgi:dUTP pyrophosphatase
MLKFAKLDPRAKAPTRKFPSDAGIDVYALEESVLAPFSYGNLRTGITIEVPADTFLLVKPKGRNNHLTGAGVIDAGYQGEVIIKVVNYSWRRLRITAGEAIAQLVHLPVICDPVEEVAVEQIHTKASDRGGTGGIHGKKVGRKQAG